MEDRTRLFHLVQMVKTNLNSRMCEYDDDSDDEGCAVVSSSYSYGRHPDEEVYVEFDEDEHGSSANVNNMAAAGFDTPPSMHKSLDFHCETTDLHQRLFTSPKGPVPKYTGHNRERTSLHSFHTGLSIKCDSLHEQTPRPATAKSFNNEPAGPTHRKRISGPCEERANAGASLHILSSAPVYESVRTAGYSDGLPHSSPAAIKRWVAALYQVDVLVIKARTQAVSMIGFLCAQVHQFLWNRGPIFACEYLTCVCLLVFVPGEQRTSGSVCVWGKDLWCVWRGGEERQMLWRPQVVIV